MVTIARRAETATPSSTKSLEVVVLHTSTRGTKAALKAASALAKGLHAQIRLLVLHPVPYPLPLSEPAVSPKFLERQFRDLVAGLGFQAHIDIRLCRDSADALANTLPKRSLVVIGAGRWWFLSSENRLAKRLRTLGHQVVVCELQEKSYA